MYIVTLINLAPDALTAAASLVPVERGSLLKAELETLLGNFCEIDAVDNAAVEPEIRVQVRHGNYLIRQGQKRLILYDVFHRDQPAQVLTVAETMAELDGTAVIARAQRTRGPAEDAAPADLLAPHRSDPLNRPRFIMLAALACLLSGVLAWRWWPMADTGAPPLAPVSTADLPPLLESLAGVYLTGTLPGHHGIALATDGDLKIFELRAVDAPRVIHATYRMVRGGDRLALATDQPGGLIEVADRDTLVYSDETYRRIP